MKATHWFLILIIMLSSHTNMYIEDEADLTEIDTNILYMPLVVNVTTNKGSLKTNIADIKAFLEQCPTNDPVYSKIRNEIIIRKEGQIIGDIYCTEPISALPVESYTEELIILQALRTIYYMDTNSPGYLPWTQTNFYSWIKNNIDGINIRLSGGGSSCCSNIGGKKFVDILVLPENRSTSKDWYNLNGGGIATIIDLIAHEVRHADGGPPHDSGCGIPNQCDPTYDLENLGSFGVQIWLHESWMAGYLNIGIGCLPESEAYWIIYMHQAMSNSYRTRISNNPPPYLEFPAPPFGGPCYQ